MELARWFSDVWLVTAMAATLMMLIRFHVARFSDRLEDS